MYNSVFNVSVSLGWKPVKHLLQTIFFLEVNINAIWGSCKWLTVKYKHLFYARKNSVFGLLRPLTIYRLLSVWGCHMKTESNISSSVIQSFSSLINMLTIYLLWNVNNSYWLYSHMSWLPINSNMLTHLTTFFSYVLTLIMKVFIIFILFIVVPNYHEASKKCG